MEPQKSGEILCGKKYGHSLGGNKGLFQLPLSKLGETYLIQEINYLNGISPVNLCWSGDWKQPFLAASGNNTGYYLDFNLCMRDTKDTGANNGYLNNPPSNYQNPYQYIYLNKSEWDVFFGISASTRAPHQPMWDFQINRTNKTMDVFNCTIYDENFEYGAQLSFKCGLHCKMNEEKSIPEGNGKVLMFYEIISLPVCNV